MASREDPVLIDDGTSAEVLLRTALLKVLKAYDPGKLALTGHDASDDGASLKASLATRSIQLVYERNCNTFVAPMVGKGAGPQRNRLNGTGKEGHYQERKYWFKREQ